MKGKTMSYRIKKDGTLDMRYSVSKIRNKKNKRQAKVLYLAICAFILGVGVGYQLGDNINVSRAIECVPELDNPNYIRVTQTFKVKRIEGIASWYGEDPSECIGCRDDLLMANGIKYNEDNFTIASNDYALGQKVQVCHDLTCVDVVVTDTGGFNALGRVADLSKATKNVLNCNDLCRVSIVNTEVLKGK